MSCVLRRTPGEQVVLTLADGREIVVTQGRQPWKLCVNAPPDVRISRREPERAAPAESSRERGERRAGRKAA